MSGESHEYALAWRGKCVGFIEDEFFLYDRAGRHIGTFCYAPNSRRRAAEIFSAGQYIGELRQGRLLFDDSKADQKPYLMPLPPRISPLPPRLWAPSESPRPMPAGCRDIDIG